MLINYLLKLMKNQLKALFVLSLFILLVGCSRISEQKPFFIEQQGLLAEETVEYQGNTIINLSYKITVPYTVMDKVTLVPLMNDCVTKYSSVHGVLSSREINEDEIILNVDIDYSQANFDDFKAMNEKVGLFLSNDTDRDFPRDLEAFEKNAKAEGFKEK